MFSLIFIAEHLYNERISSLSVSEKSPSGPTTIQVGLLQVSLNLTLLLVELRSVKIKSTSFLSKKLFRFCGLQY